MPRGRIVRLVRRRTNNIKATRAPCAALIASSALIAGAAAIAGCQKPLFPPNTPRTPFELHDKMRDRYRPTEEPDVFGKPQPALRARLGRQDE